VCGWQVKLCDPLVTRGPYLSTLDIGSLYIKRYINSPSLLYFFYFLLLLQSCLLQIRTSANVDPVPIWSLDLQYHRWLLKVNDSCKIFRKTRSVVLCENFLTDRQTNGKTDRRVNHNLLGGGKQIYVSNINLIFAVSLLQRLKNSAVYFLPRCM